MFLSQKRAECSLLVRDELVHPRTGVKYRGLVKPKLRKGFFLLMLDNEFKRKLKPTKC